MTTANSSAKPRQLLKSPEVTLSPEVLTIEGQYYTLNQTRGVVVDKVPPPPKPEIQPAVATPKQPLTFGAILKGIGMVLIVILAILFGWLFEDLVAGSGSSQQYQLVLIHDSGSTIALKHTNRNKLNKVAEAINQALVARGKMPDTGSYQPNK